MIITELKYTFKEINPFIPLNIQKGTGTFIETAFESEKGNLITSEIKIYLPKITDEHNKLVMDLTGYGAIFQAKVTDGNTYTIGKDELRANLTFERKLADNPGGRSGYNIKINWKSLSGSKMEVL